VKGSTFGLGCAFLIVAVVAFMAGLLFAKQVLREREPSPRANAGNPELFNPYSPNPMSDPYFIEQERKNVEALEANCRATGKHCKEAAQLRQWLAGRGVPP
jgi:hypothetical protein